MSEIALFVYLLDEAFEGRGVEESNESQSLLGNLATVDESIWRVVPAGGSRSIEAITRHVAECKVMYVDHAFGAGRLTWTSSEVARWPAGAGPLEAVMAWLRDSQDTLIRHVTALTDDELDKPRMANWGSEHETRWLLSMLLQHDLYHAGEINHIRSLLAGDDRWRFQQLGFG